MPLLTILHTPANSTSGDTLYDGSEKINLNNNYLEGKIDTEISDRASEDNLKADKAGDTITGNFTFSGTGVDYYGTLYEHDGTTYGGIAYYDTGKFSFGSANNADIAFNTNGTERMSIDHTTGRVTILTSFQCGDIIALGSDQTSGNVSTLAGFNAKNYGEIVEEDNNVSGAYDINIANGNVFLLGITGATTFSLVSSHTNYSFTLVLDNGGLNVTWPTGTKWEGGNVPNLSLTGRDVIVFTVIGTFIAASAILDVK